MIKDNNTKELFEYIRTFDTKNISSLKSILSSYNTGKLNIEDVIELLRTDRNNVLLIDARSESEFEESHLPYSLNFPLLTNPERHNVGLIYKKYSQSSALLLAKQYADPKSEALKSLLENNNAYGKKIIVYCWRGGGRSGYLSKMIIDLGYNPSVITGGHKALRRSVNDFFNINPFPFELIELSGLTGSGKTELLKYVSDELPVIDLEDAAKHYSSLLGQLPYYINNIPPVKNQSAFENNIFSDIFFKPSYLNYAANSNSSINSTNLTNFTNSTFLIESESKRVGNFEIPKSLFDKMQISSSVKISCTLDCRIKRIVRDYFGEDFRGIEPMKNKLLEKEKFFKQQLSNKIFNDIISKLDSGRVYEPTEIMIKEYYDKKYKDKGKKHIAEISSDDMRAAGEELINLYKNNFNQKSIPKL